MQIPLQIAFKGVSHSNALEAEIRQRAAKLDRFSGGRLISCRVTVQEPNRRHQQGDLFVVTIDASIPGAELVAGDSEGHGLNHAHENPYIALRDAFQAMERQIKDYRQIRRKPERRLNSKSQARVSRFFPQDGYGFITTQDGRDLYFHVNSLISHEGPAHLDVGVEVLFTEELGDEGPQAATLEYIRTAAS